MQSSHMRKLLPQNGKGYTYLHPTEICPNIGPQNHANNPCGSHGGFCATFSTMFAHMRLTHPETNPNEITETMTSLSSDELTDLIQRYQSYIDFVVSDVPTELEAFQRKYFVDDNNGTEEMVTKTVADLNSD